MPGMILAELPSWRISSSSGHSSLLTARSLRLASSRLSGPRTGRTAPASDTANPALFIVGLYQERRASVCLSTSCERSSQRHVEAVERKTGSDIAIPSACCERARLGTDAPRSGVPVVCYRSSCPPAPRVCGGCYPLNLRYIVTTAAPPRPRLCWSATLASFT